MTRLEQRTWDPPILYPIFSTLDPWIIWIQWMHWITLRLIRSHLLQSKRRDHPTRQSVQMDLKRKTSLGIVEIFLFFWVNGHDLHNNKSSNNNKLFYFSILCSDMANPTLQLSKGVFSNQGTVDATLNCAHICYSLFFIDFLGRCKLETLHVKRER